MRRVDYAKFLDSFPETDIMFLEYSKPLPWRVFRVKHKFLLVLSLFLALSSKIYAASWEEYYEKGLNLALSGRFEEANGEFRYALQIDPYLVHVSSCLKISDDAVSKTIAGEAAVWIFKGIDLGNKERWDEAIDAISKAIVLEPSYPDAFNERGIAHMFTRQYEEAKADFTKAIELKPNYEYAYGNRASCYESLGLTDKAISDLSKAIEIDPYYALAHYNRGLLYCAKTRQYDLAIRDLTRALEFDQKFGDAYVDRGIAFYCLGEYDEAIADFNKAIKIGPGDVRAYWNKALCFEVKDMPAEAIELYRQVISLAEPGSGYIKDAYGRIAKCESRVDKTTPK